MKRPLSTSGLATIAVAALILMVGCSSAQGETSAAKQPDGAVIDHVVQSLSGETVDLAQYRGKALLIVNTASKCGYTRQYADLQKVYETYSDRGLVVIGFPSNDYGGQEPGSAEEIANFCQKNYGVTFPMMAKVHTKGSKKAPIYRALTEGSASDFQGEVRWNFTKFLVDPEGNVVGRFESGVAPTSKELIQSLEEILPG